MSEPLAPEMTITQALRFGRGNVVFLDAAMVGVHVLGRGLVRFAESAGFLRVNPTVAVRNFVMIFLPPIAVGSGGENDNANGHWDHGGMIA